MRPNRLLARIAESRITPNVIPIQQSAVTVGCFTEYRGGKMATESETAITISPVEVNPFTPEVALRITIAELLEGLTGLKVTDKETEAIASSGLVRIRNFRKNFDADRKGHLKPLREYTSKLNSKCDELIAPLNPVEADIVRQLGAYRKAVDKAAQKEQARLQRLAERRQERAEAKGEVPVIPEVLAPIVEGAPKSIDTEGGKVSWRIDWKAERIKGQEHLIPRDLFHTEIIYKVIDVKVPGYRIYSEKVPVTRPK
jgi:hypothetical protein